MKFECRDIMKNNIEVDWLGDKVMLNIGDFSKIAKVSIKTLRYYDRIGLLKPEIVDHYTGYRKYSVLQINRLNRILFYKDIGFSLKQILEIINQDLPVNQMKKYLQQNIKRLESDISTIQNSLDTLHQRIHQIDKIESQPNYEIKLIEPQHYNIAFGKVIIPTIKDITHYSNLFYHNLYSELDRINVRYIGPEMNLYHNTEYVETNLEMEFAVGISGTPEEIEKLSQSNLSYREIQDKNLTASLKFAGDYHDLFNPIIELLSWIESNNFQLDGELRELHISGKAHINGKLVKDAVVELQIPVKENENL